mgnify:CR=1 FL=1
MTSGYGSHFPILAAALARTTGPVLECGIGDFSTPMIHYATMPNRLVVSADTDPDWICKFKGYSSNRHNFYLVEPAGDDALPPVTRKIEGWQKFSIIDQFSWGCVFLDCAPGEARHEIAIRLSKRAELIVAHDSETDYQSGGNYQYDKAKPHFRFVSEFKKWRPYTLILSNVMEFKIEDCDATWEPPK